MHVHVCVSGYITNNDNCIIPMHVNFIHTVPEGICLLCICF